MLTRRGVTLVELLVAMTLAAIVLGAAGTTLVRQRRESNGSSSRASAESQLRAALADVPAAVAALSPATGDLAQGEARDTALQIRSVVVQGASCDSTAGQVILSANDSGAERETAVVAAPRVGDTLWWWSPGAAAWASRRVTMISGGSGPCAREGGRNQPLLRLWFSTLDTVPRDAVLRVTRQVRYSIYRAGDGSWQLGIAEWSDVLHGFAAPQPVAGPFLFAPLGGSRTGFRYFDASGGELPVTGQGAEVGAVARLRVTVIARTNARGAPQGVLRDSVDVAFGHVP